MDKSPLPFIGELLEFVIYAFSHVDGQNEVALKKELQRLKSGAVISTDKVGEMLDKHLGYLSGYPAFGLEVRETVEALIVDYCKMVLRLNCHVLPVEDVRAILVRELAPDVCFAFPGKALMEIGVDPQNWMHRPDQVVSGIWTAFFGKRKMAIPTFAKELASRLAKNNMITEDKTVKDNLYRWQKTGKMNVRSILQILEAGYEALAIALLYGNAFQKFWGRVPSTLREEAFHSWQWAYDNGSRLCQTEPIIEALQNTITSRSLDEYPKLSGSSASETALLEHLKDLTNPNRTKTPGDAEQAAVLLEEVELLFADHEGVDGLQIYRGRYHILKGDFKKALKAFDRACSRQAYRNGPAILNTLEPLLVTAAHLGEKRTQKKWADWAGVMGLKLDIYRADALFYRMFPPENFYHETETALHIKAKEKTIGANLISTEPWKNRPPDFRYLDRMIKGYGPTAKPQLYIFAHSRQPDKVKKLLAKGANPNVLCENNGSPLLGAIQGGCERSFAILLPATNLKIINQQTRQTGRTCLGEAVSAGNIDMVRALLGYGADPNVRSEMDHTPLYQSVEFFAKIVSEEQFIQGVNEATLNMVPQSMQPSASPFHQERLVAMKQQISNDIRDYPEITKAMLEHFNNGSGVPMQTRFDVVKALLEASANPNAKHKGGFTPFLLAAEQGADGVVELILSSAANRGEAIDQGYSF